MVAQTSSVDVTVVHFHSGPLELVFSAFLVKACLSYLERIRAKMCLSDLPKANDATRPTFVFNSSHATVSE